MSAYTPAQARRDLNGHKPARAAAYIWGAEYARLGLGLMGFWDQLDESRRNTARQLVDAIEHARDETALERRATRKATR
jgi:hypothetical protein